MRPSRAVLPRSTSEIQKAIAEGTGLSEREVASVLESLANLTRQDLLVEGSGEFTIPDLVSIHVVHKPAREASTIRDPSTGRTKKIRAKPARREVRVRALESLRV